MTGTAFVDTLDSDDLGSNKIARSATAYALYNNGLAAWESAHALVLDYQVFTANGSWTKPSDLDDRDTVIIRQWGGGESGGCNAAGGSGGGHFELSMAAIDCPSALTITRGAGGTPVGVGAVGVAGGDTTVTDGASFTVVSHGGGSIASGVGGKSTVLGVSIDDPMFSGANGYGASSFYGGAAGGSVHAGSGPVNPGGASAMGGDGGDGGTASGVGPTSGAIPGGGGGQGANTNPPSGAGARGEVRISVLRGWHPTKYCLSV